jgi:gamma-glutamyltranspeptidase/glutathione hydrolase
MRSRLLALVPALVALAVPPAAHAQRPAPAKHATEIGAGGAVASADPDATRVGIQVLRRGGNAIDAAVATAATLGVTEPYVAGIGGGGFLVIYSARDHRVHTIDGRETAPADFPENVFIDPNTGKPIPFTPDRVTTGLAVGVPGTLASWQVALRGFGTESLRQALRPATTVAQRGFVVDETFQQQTADNLDRLKLFTPSRQLFLTSDLQPPAVGTVLRNPDLARAYRTIGRQGTRALYRGAIGRTLLRTVRRPPLAPDAQPSFRVIPGRMTARDLRAYRALRRPPTSIRYRGLRVFGMAPPSSGGSTVAEALNILEGFDLSGPDRALALHRYLEASRLAFADRNRWVGDPRFFAVPLAGLLSQGFAAERRCLIGDRAPTSPVAPGDPTSPPFDRSCSGTAGTGAAAAQTPGSTNHLVVADRQGNVVSYTNTIEQIAGSAIAVPGWGFLLNNELTDFDPEPLAAGVPDPNLPAGGKRPRSSMAPTIVLRGRRPVLAVGSPGGSTIITTVLQILVNRLDFGMTLPQAIAAPRASQRNAANTEAEPAFSQAFGQELTTRFGQSFAPVDEIGDATGVEIRRNGTLVSAAEPVRRGGGDARVACRGVGPRRCPLVRRAAGHRRR